MTRALLVFAAISLAVFGLSISGLDCATTGTPDPCAGDPSTLPCTCGGQTNPACVPWIHDQRAQDAGD